MKAGIDVNMLYMLECFDRNIDIKLDPNNMQKEASWLSALMRKNFIGGDGIITADGKMLLLTLKTNTSFVAIKKARQAVAVTEFDRWWSTYPSSDIFDYKGTKFAGSRTLKMKKDDCRKKFLEIVAEGEYSAQDLIRSLEFDVMMKKEASLRDKENKLKWFQNSLTYLNQRTFEGMVELSKNYKPTTSTNTVDI